MRAVSSPSSTISAIRSTGDDDADDLNIDPSPASGYGNDVPDSTLGSTSVTINEVDGHDSTAFIELYNHSGRDANISGWALIVDDTYVIPENTIVPAYGFWVLDGNEFPSYFSLDADTDNIYLFDNTGQRVDQIGWSGEATGSWNRIPDGEGVHDGWTESMIPLYDGDSSKAESNGGTIPLSPAIYYLLD